MSREISLTITDELESFLQSQSGEGTMYASPDEYIRSLLREKKERLEASRIREDILEGYHDAISGNATLYEGNLRSIINESDD